MKLYLANGTYVGTQADAKKIDKQFVEIEVPTDKPGLIAYLNANFAHRDVDFDDLNADRVVKDVNEDIHPERAIGKHPALAAPYAELSTNLDELFANAPLAHRLTLASMALEDARDLCPSLEKVVEAGDKVVAAAKAAHPKGWETADTSVEDGAPLGIPALDDEVDPFA